MNHRLTVRRRAFACAAIVLALAACRTQPARPAEAALYYYDIGHEWTTRKRRVKLYACTSGTKVCEGEASRLDVVFRCRCA